MIRHESKYGQTLLFPSELYTSVSDDELAEIEENCSSFQSEVVKIGADKKPETDEIPSSLDRLDEPHIGLDKI